VHSYIALQGRETKGGTFAECVLWARARVCKGSPPVKIARARAGEKHARVVAEIAPEGERLIRGGRYVRAP
jgi:hypothetical protein